MRSARSGCERPEKTISRFCGVSGIAWPGFNVGSAGASRPGRVCSTVPASTTPLLDGLSGREAHERVLGDVVGYDRARSRPCVVSESDRCNEDSVHTDPDVTADLGPLLRPAAVGKVDGDRAGADVRPVADLCV